jgi:hypothetical protein
MLKNIRVVCGLGAMVLALSSCTTDLKYPTQPTTGTTAVSCRPRIYPWTYMEPEKEISAQNIGGIIATNPLLLRVIINDGRNNLGFRIAKADLTQPLSTNQEYTFRWEWRKKSRHYDSGGWVHTVETTLLSIDKAGTPVYAGKFNPTNGYENLMQRSGGEPF